MENRPPGGFGGPFPGLPPDGGTEGWWEDAPPWWHDESAYEEGDGWAPFPRRRRSRVLQATGIVVAAALVLASAGTTIEVVLGATSSHGVPAEVTSVVVLPVDSAGGGGSTTPVRVAFEVVNAGRTPIVPNCTVSVVQDGRVLATAQVGPPELGSIPAGKRTANNTVVPVPTSALTRAGTGGMISCHS